MKEYKSSMTGRTLTLEHMGQIYNIDAMVPSHPYTPPIKDVHTEHCCIDCGCKYGEPDCTVVTGILKASAACEDCENEVLRMIAWFENTTNAKRERVMKAVRVDKPVDSGISNNDWLHNYKRIAKEAQAAKESDKMADFEDAKNSFWNLWKK